MSALTALTFLPATLLLMTGFTRIIIVLSLLRQALGTQPSPPNQVLIGRSLFLTLHVMGPVLDTVYNDAYLPFAEQKTTSDEALDHASPPLKTFMLKQTRDIVLFSKLGKHAPVSDAQELPLRISVPAFVTSELIVASVLMSMGMMMVSPVLVALPFKLMLFVLADSWNFLLGSLVASFGA